MKTMAQQLNVKEFPFIIKDNDGNVIYFENSDGNWYKKEWKDGNVIYFETSEVYWSKREYKDGEQVYYENSEGIIEDNRPEERPCVGKKVTIDGVEYELK
jgi:hypothetical protein